MAILANSLQEASYSILAEDDVFHNYSLAQEEGFILVISGEPEVEISGVRCQARPGDLFHFKVGDTWSYTGVARVLTFFGNFNGKYQAS